MSSVIPRSQMIAMLIVGTTCQSCIGPKKGIEITNRDTRVGSLSISVIFPKGEYQQNYIGVGLECQHFHVILENVSSKPLMLWRGLAYAGYTNLSFRLTDRIGNVFIVKRPGFPGTSEVENHIILSPRERTVIDVYPTSDEWIGFPPATVEPKPYTLQAIYSSPMPKEVAIGWTGQVVSPIYNFDLVK